MGEKNQILKMMENFTYSEAYTQRFTVRINHVSKFQTAAVGIITFCSIKPTQGLLYSAVESLTRDAPLAANTNIFCLLITIFAMISSRSDPNRHKNYISA